MSLSDIHRSPITRVEEDDPTRCQAVVATRGQCLLKAVEGRKYCPIHGGTGGDRGVERASLYKYRLAQHQMRLDALTDSTSIKNLRDEVAVLRFLVQKRLDTVGPDLLLHSGAISRLILQISSLTVSCAKVEHSLDEVMEKTDVLDLAHSIIMASRKFAPDKAAVDRIINDITSMLDRMHHRETGSTTSNYKLTKWQDSLSSYLSNERLISVRGEIGVLRLLVEERLNRCNDDQDLIFESGPISALISDVEKLVTSCHKLEVSMGLLVDKEVALEFGQELILVVGNHIKDSDSLLEISQCLEQ